MKLAVIGLGTMGMGAALNLAAKGHEVVGLETRQDAWAELERAGGRCVGTRRGTAGRAGGGGVVRGERRPGRGGAVRGGGVSFSVWRAGRW